MAERYETVTWRQPALPLKNKNKIVSAYLHFVELPLAPLVIFQAILYLIRIS